MFLRDIIFRIPQPAPRGLQDMEDAEEEFALRPNLAQCCSLGVTVVSDKTLWVKLAVERNITQHLLQKTETCETFSKMNEVQIKVTI